MVRLTPKIIKETELPPGRSQLIIWDDELAGFGLRVTRAAKAYILEYRSGNSKKQQTIGRDSALSPSEARNKARKLLSQRNYPAAAPPAQKKTVPTLREALDRYLQARPLKEITQKRFQYHLNKYLPDWLDLPLSSISKQMVEERFRELTTAPTRGNTGGKGRANVVFSNLNTIMRFSIMDCDLDILNPVSVLTNNKAWHRLYPRPGVVPDDKLPAWYSSVMALANKNHRDYFLLLAFCGFRRATAARLLWSQVDFEQKVIVIPPEESKSHREQRLPMSDFVFDLMKERYEERVSECVFPRRYLRNPKRHMSFVDNSHEIVRRECGADFTLHDLRRLFLTVATFGSQPGDEITLKDQFGEHAGRN